MRLSEKRYLHHCSFRSEMNQRTGDKRITLMKKVCCQLSPSSHEQVRGARIRAKNENQVAKWRTKESGFSLKDRKIKFSLMLEPRFRNMKFKPILIEEVSRNWMELLSLSEEKLNDHTLASDQQLRRDQLLLLHERLSEQNWDLREAHWKVFLRWKNWSDFKGKESMNFREEDWSKIRTLLMNSRPGFRNYRMKLTVLMTQEIFKKSRLSRNDRPPDNWDTHGKSGNFFVNPPASSSSPYPGGFNPWISNVKEDTSPHVTSERQNPDTTLYPRCQSGPSAGKSFDPKEGRFSKNYGADQRRLQISELHFDKFPTPATFACWKMRFKTEECSCSQFPTESMQWIKEVELVDSVDEIYSWYFNAEFWSAWCEDCFSAEQNHP